MARHAQGDYYKDQIIAVLPRPPSPEVVDVEEEGGYEPDDVPGGKLCVICHGGMWGGVELECKHEFDVECLRLYERTGKTYPMC